MKGDAQAALTEAQRESDKSALPVRACKHDPTYVDADYGPEEPRVADAREAQTR